MADIAPHGTEREFQRDMCAIERDLAEASAHCLPFLLTVSNVGFATNVDLSEREISYERVFIGTRYP